MLSTTILVEDARYRLTYRPTDTGAVYEDRFIPCPRRGVLGGFTRRVRVQGELFSDPSMGCGRVMTREVVCASTSSCGPDGWLACPFELAEWEDRGAPLDDMAAEWAYVDTDGELLPGTGLRVSEIIALDRLNPVSPHPCQGT